MKSIIHFLLLLSSKINNSILIKNGKLNEIPCLNASSRENNDLVFKSKTQAQLVYVVFMGIPN